MRFRSGFFGLCLLSSFIAAFAGCGKGSSDSIANAVRSRVLVDTQPADVSSLAEIYASEDAMSQVTVAGRIFALEMSPFDKESAAFNIIELPAPGHEHEDPGDCPFCRREIENAPAAVVQVADESGEVIKQPADQLLQLKENQDVVVHGTASKVGDLLVISAESILVLDEAAATELRKELIDAASADKDSSEFDSVPAPPPFPAD